MKSCTNESCGRAHHRTLIIEADHRGEQTAVRFVVGHALLHAIKPEHTPRTVGDDAQPPVGGNRRSAAEQCARRCEGQVSIIPLLSAQLKQAAQPRWPAPGRQRHQMRIAHGQLHALSHALAHTASTAAAAGEHA